MLKLPLSVSGWPLESHLAHFINDALAALDLEAFRARYEGASRKRPLTTRPSAA